MRSTSFIPDRRQFLLSSAAALIAAHRCLGSHETTGPASPRAEPLIRSLELITAAALPSMKDFYHGLIGLPVLEDRPERLTLRAGSTQLAFVPAQARDGNPFYHFAFNIPQNKILAARTWQKERTALLPIPRHLRDPKYPDEVVDYRHWNAHSIFFFDPAENVVEYIARHDLDDASSGPFSVKDILYASEIGLIVDDVPDVASALRQTLGLTNYRGASAQFAALGDELGLLLVMKRGRIVSFDAAEKKAVSVFRTAATIRGKKPTDYRFSTFPYEVRVEA